MQPYFFPYFGYFQLINASDYFVNLDHVNFKPRTYMVRNTLKNNVKLNIPVSNSSQNKKCSEIFVKIDNKYLIKTKKTFEHLYSKYPNYEEILDTIIIPSFNVSEKTISNFNLMGIKNICDYLDINTKFYETSEGLTNHKKGDGLIEITKHFNHTDYLNAIGGQSLYSKDEFSKSNVNLHFIKMGNLDVDHPYNSIIDLLFRYEKEHLKKELNNYILV